MFGTGLLKGLGVTLKHFVETYVDDVRAIPSRYAGGRDFIRQTPDEEGLFTIQYPEEKRQLPERFRYIPMLIYDTPKGEDRCTACGICAKVCPPQCIWIVRDKDEKGKPVPRAAEFYIDASICMSCGFCSEFCPFDAIKMNHDYELAVYQRYPNLVYNMQELTVPLEYYASLYPTQFAEEEKRRAEEEAKKAKKPAREARKPAAPAKAAPAAAVAADKPAAARTATTLSPEELEKRRAEAKARAAARKGAAAEEAVAPEAKALPATARTATTLSPEELEKRRAEAKARAAARKGAAAEEAAPAPEAKPTPAPEAKAAPAPEAKAPPPAAAAVAGYGKPKLAAVARTSGSLGYAALEERRAAAHERYKARKGPDAKVLHAAAAPAEPAQPLAEAVEEAAEAVAETVVTPPPAEPAPQEAAEAAPPPPPAAEASQPGGFGKPKLASASRTSGTVDYAELEKRRAENYARYKARKGPDAKDLSH